MIASAEEMIFIRRVGKTKVVKNLTSYFKMDSKEYIGIGYVAVRK